MTTFNVIHSVAVAALASWLGDQQDLSVSLTELNRPDGGTRMSAADWAEQERRLRVARVDEATIDNLRMLQGPATTGASAVEANVSGRSDQSCRPATHGGTCRSL